MATLAELESLEAPAGRLYAARVIVQISLRRSISRTRSRAVERHAAHAGVQLVQAAQLAVLACHVPLLHRGDLDVELEVGEMEVGRDRLAHPALRVAAEHEHVRLVGPAYAQSVESSGALDLGLMGKSRHGQSG